MSIAIPGSDEFIIDLALEAGYMAGRAMHASGMHEQYAYTQAAKAGTYAGIYLLAALQQNGLLRVSDLDIVELKESLRRLDSAAGVAAAIGEPIVITSPDMRPSDAY